MNTLYLLSNSLDYSRLICNDAGPGYAATMNWDCIYLDDVKNIDDQTLIVVDNRLQKYELNKLTGLITQHAKTIFLLKIVDPYIENQEHYYYQFIAGASSLKNAYLFSVYQAKEITDRLKAQFGNRYLHLPYPYLKSKEVNNTYRKNKILISGSLNAEIYPYRYAIWKKTTRSISRILFFSLLKHPGYAELNNNGQYAHKVIKDDFINHLSRFRYMLLCPSRCNIEFLKFNECAYAGCLPVGMAPDAYPGHIKQLFLNLRLKYFLKDVLNILFKKQDKNTVEIIRQFLHETRNPDKLNKILKEFILENPIHTS